VEGAVLLVDATQGIQRQTLANLYLAINENLTVVPVINKIDLPAADVAKVKREIVGLIGCSEDEILLASGKTGAGVVEVFARTANFHSLLGWNLGYFAQTSNHARTVFPEANKISSSESQSNDDFRADFATSAAGKSIFINSPATDC